MCASPAQDQVAVYAITFPHGPNDYEGMERIITDRFGSDSIVRFCFEAPSQKRRIALPCVSASWTATEHGHECRDSEARALVLTDLDARSIMSDVDGAVVEKASA
ncbi:MAG: hypothetical protein ACYDHN_01650 [Solirubrobacteraceae bacterium]